MKFSLVVVNSFLVSTLFVIQGSHSNDVDYKLTQSSKNLKEQVNTYVNPCEDFYHFSCGSWLDKNDEPKPNYGGFGGFNMRQSYWNFTKYVGFGKYNKLSKTLEKLRSMKITCTRKEFRNLECQGKVEEFSSYAFVTYYFHTHVLNQERYWKSLDKVQEMFENIHEEFVKIIVNDDEILDDRSKKNVLRKLKHMKFDRHFLEHVYSIDRVEKCYDLFDYDLQDKPEDILKKLNNYGNNTKAVKGDYPCIDFINKKNFFHLYYSDDIDIDYLSNFNIIAANPTILRDPHFNIDFIDALNYGGMGSLIGNKIGTAFNRQNIHFDADHNITMLLTDESRKKYDDMFKCMERKYNKDKKDKVDEKVTLDDNYADNIGLKIAHKAYMNYLQKNGDYELKVPDFEIFTREQLFFINYGRSYCELGNKLVTYGVIDKSKVKPGQVRVTKTLANYESFAKAFNCKVGSSMNPKDKCKVW
uniref:Phosphate-regulating neutral endopeptidase (inferred by orthology to a human protein) n=1 Tax=Strongyloides venezuelensis TaxID=75913 RepID=A0A0K0FQA0_STRVS